MVNGFVIEMASKSEIVESWQVGWEVQNVQNEEMAWKVTNYHIQYQKKKKILITRIEMFSNSHFILAE
jgi:hypothetical protein